MLVTIITDASVDHTVGTGGYGFWAVSKRGKYAGQGVFGCRVESSNAAEMMAIVNAIHIALRKGVVHPGDDILVQTDSMHAISHFSGVRKKNSQAAIKYRPLVDRLNALTMTENLSIKFRHVKGHTRSGDKRSKAQRMADKRARAAMRGARASELSEDRT